MDFFKKWYNIDILQLPNVYVNIDTSTKSKGEIF